MLSQRIGRVERKIAPHACDGYDGTGKVVGFLAGRAVAELATTGRSDDVRPPAVA
jgi:hypothetical protein